MIHVDLQMSELLIMQFSPLPCYLARLRPKYLPQHPILEHPQPISSLNVPLHNEHSVSRAKSSELRSKGVRSKTPTVPYDVFAIYFSTSKEEPVQYLILNQERLLSVELPLITGSLTTFLSYRHSTCPGKHPSGTQVKK